MARVIKGKVPIDNIVVDMDLYPRTSTFWAVSYKYSQMMNAGSQFPPIVLALYKGSQILVDGKHRIDASKILKLNNIEAEIHMGWDRKKIYEEAIKRNLAHGISLSPYEVRNIILKLRTMNYQEDEISGLVKVPIGKMEKFVAGRAINVITGEAIGEHQQVIIKPSLKHLAGSEYSMEELSNINQSQGSLTSKTQLNLLDHIIILLEDKLIDLKDKKIKSRLGYIKKLIKGIKV